MKLEEARALYPEIKNLLPLASQEWSESYNLRDCVAEICIPNRFSGEVEPIAHILADCPFDDRRMMLKAPVYIQALWVLLQEAFRHIQKDEARDAPPEKKEKNPFAKACAVLCGKHRFRQFLTSDYGLDAADGERVNTKVRFILEIASRTELDTDPAARERWFSLVRQYEKWERAQR